VIDADRTDFDVKIADAELVEEFLLNRLARFGAEAANAFVGVVARERGQVHASDGAKKPGDLPIFFHSAAGYEGGRTALDGGSIDANRFDPIEIERSAAIGMERTAGESSDGSLAGDGLNWSDGRAVAVDDFKARRIFRMRHEKLQWHGTRKDNTRGKVEARAGKVAEAVSILGWTAGVPPSFFVSAPTKGLTKTVFLSDVWQAKELRAQLA